VLRLDKFGTPIQFNFSGDVENQLHRTAKGTFCNIGIMMLTLMFALEQLSILHLRDATQLTGTLLKRYHDDTYIFTEQNGFQLAFAVLDFASADGSDVLGRPEEEYMEVLVQLVSLTDGFGNPPVRIETHPCTDSDLGLVEGGERTLFPIEPSHKH